MNRKIYHNAEAKAALVALICNNNPHFTDNRAVVETTIDQLTASAIEGARTRADGVSFAETIGARVTAHHETEGGHNHFYVEYHYATNTGTAFDYSEYKPVESTVAVEAADPELIVGMIADEGDY